MRRSINVPLPDEALQALADAARRELRSTREQAAYLILAGLRGRDATKAEPTDTRPERIAP